MTWPCTSRRVANSDGSLTVISTKMKSCCSVRSWSFMICRRFSAYSAASPASGSFATSRTVRRAQSRMNICAVSSRWTSVTRSSKARVSRDVSETTKMPAMNSAEMVMPSGFSITFAARAYSRISVSTREGDGRGRVAAAGPR